MFSVALTLGLAQGAAVGRSTVLENPTVSTCPAAFTIEVFNTSNQKIGEYETTEASLRRRFAAGPAYWWDCVYLNSDTGNEAFLVKYDIVPAGAAGQIASGDCARKRPDSPPFYHSRKRYLTVHGGPRAVLQQAVGGSAKILLKSTQATATFSTGQALDFVVGFAEKARKPSRTESRSLGPLVEGESAQVARCAAAVLLFDPLTSRDKAEIEEAIAKDRRVRVMRSSSVVQDLCVVALEQIAEQAEVPRRRQMASAGATSRCFALTIAFASSPGRRPKAAFLETRTSPVLAATCKAITSSLALTVRGKGATTLRAALGKTSRLTLARSSKAGPVPRSTIRLSFKQR